MHSKESAAVESHILTKFRVYEQLGSGAYGCVWRAEEKDVVHRPRAFALKKVVDAFQNVTDSQRTFREVLILKSLEKHPNVISLHSVLPSESESHLYIVFELMECDLRRVIRAALLLPAHKSWITCQILRALKFLHSAGVVHRDLKPENVLMSSDCTAKLADFGLARCIASEESPQQQQQLLMTDYVATRYYRPPEVLLGANHYGFAIDTWATGAILAEMFLNAPLFAGQSTLDQLGRICGAIARPKDLHQMFESAGVDYNIGSTLLQNLPRLYSTPLRQLVAAAPDDAMDLVERLLEFSPQERCTAAAALSHSYVEEYHCNQSEPVATKRLVLPVSDCSRLSVETYKQLLFAECEQQQQQQQRTKKTEKKEKKTKKKEKKEKKEKKPKNEMKETKGKDKKDKPVDSDVSTPKSDCSV